MRGLSVFEGRFSIPPPGTVVNMKVLRRSKGIATPVSNILIDSEGGRFIARLEKGKTLESGEEITVTVLFNGQPSATAVGSVGQEC